MSFVAARVCNPGWVCVFARADLSRRRNTQEALSNRMDALDILAEAAVILSALPEPTPPPSVSAHPHANAPSTQMGGGRGGRGGYDIYLPSSGKTRRWSNRSNVKAAAVGVNQFGQLLEVSSASTFARPLPAPLREWTRAVLWDAQR